ncbi:hypothetical protein HanIR_Chr08g0369831 [Helianthus annuus]|nr:hypothetical protein HanIR_Chr08g0369831 [Helianthus annuus]
MGFFLYKYTTIPSLHLHLSLSPLSFPKSAAINHHPTTIIRPCSIHSITIQGCKETHNEAWCVRKSKDRSRFLLSTTFLHSNSPSLVLVTMPPRRDAQPFTAEEIAALVSQQMAAVLPGVVTQLR